MTKTTAARRKAFLEAYARCGVISEAAAIADINRDTHRNWMQDPDYQRAFGAAEQEAFDIMLREARKRAVEGADDQIVYQGEVQYKRDENGKLTNIPATVRRQSDVLLMFLMKGARPEIYRDNWQGEIKHTGNIDVSHRIELKRLTDDAIDQLEQMFRLNDRRAIDAEHDDE